MNKENEERLTASRLDGDSRKVVLVATWLVVALGIAAFAMGVPGLLVVGDWAGLAPRMRWLVPVVLDVGLLIMALSAVVRRARRESAVFAMTALGVLTALSVAAQIAHVVVPAGGVITGEVIGGAVISAVAPLTVFVSTHVLLDLAIAPAPVSRRKRKKAPAKTRPATPAQTRSAGAPKPVAAAESPRPAVTAKTPARARGDREAEKAEALRLRGQGLSYAKVSEATKVPPSTVKRWVKEAEEEEGAISLHVA